MRLKALTELRYNITKFTLSVKALLSANSPLGMLFLLQVVLTISEMR